VIFLAVTIGLTFIPHPFPWWLIGAVITFLCAIEIPMSFIRVRSIGYALRQDDLVFKRGVIARRLVAVPYGRLQVIDVSRGLLDRMLGIASLTTVTAAASTNVSIPGLTPDEADQLRDHLIRVAETRRAGL
jgi:membrane protein YdbS with pleckstrin-like domain